MGVGVFVQLLTDRVMVRVGGGWETLEHFLLKHDPCRIENITGMYLLAQLFSLAMYILGLVSSTGLKTNTTGVKTRAQTTKSAKNGRNKSKFLKPTL